MSHKWRFEGVKKQVEFRDFGTVWFNDQSLANILSFAQVKKTANFKVSYNQVKNAFIVTLPDKLVVPFIQSQRGLYYNDVYRKSDHYKAFAFINTVQDNMNLFAPRQVKKAVRLLALYILNLAVRPLSYFVIWWRMNSFKIVMLMSQTLIELIKYSDRTLVV